MDAVETLAADPSAEGMWWVPRGANPTGETGSDEPAPRLAAMPTGAPDLRLFWHDACAVHHPTERRTPPASVLEGIALAGLEKRAEAYPAGCRRRASFARRTSRIARRGLIFRTDQSRRRVRAEPSARG